MISVGRYYRWVRIVEGKTRITYFNHQQKLDLNNQNALLRRMHAKYPDNFNEEVLSIDQVSDSANQALLMCDYDAKQSRKLILQVLEQINLGYYNNTIVEYLLHIVDIEFQEGEKRQEEYTELLKSLPAKTTSGPSETWMMSALSLYGTLRIENLETRGNVMKSIENEFAGEGVKE